MAIMTIPALTDTARAFLRTPAPAVVATIGRNGQPVSAATWYLLQDDDTILMNIQAGRARVRHLQADPRVALTVLGEDWYQHISIQGRVTEIHDDPDLAEIDRISEHYTGKPYPVRDKQRVSAVVTIDRWFGWHAG
jgi:PPOX class probable F420-dependent enzyme